PLHGFAVVTSLSLGDSVGIHDKRAMLALSDLSLELGCLPVGHPDIGYVAPGRRLVPQQQDINAPVRRTVVAQGPGDTTFGIVRMPGFHPRPDTLLEVAQDAVGYASVNVGAD